MLSRRGLITGLAASLLAAPAIVRASSLMTVKPFAPALPDGWAEYRVEHDGKLIRLTWRLVIATDEEIGDIVTHVP